MEKEESKVLETANPVSEIRAQWAWVEPSVWTDRMLEALENGINGVEESKWFCLIDKVCKPANLMSAWLKTASNDGAAGVDHVTVKGYAKQLETNLERVRDQVGSGVYHPSRIRRTYIPKPGGGEFCPLGIPIVQDRVVGTAVRHVIEPIFEQTFSENSFGFRPGRGCKDALRQVFNLLKVGNHYVVDADLRQCFDRIPHDKLINRVKERVADKKVLELIRRFLKQEILDDGSVFAPENTGTPQGATLSPLLCNIYLNPLDHLMAEEGFDMIRYADDLVVVCRSQQEAERALDVLTQWVESNGLELHPDKTRIADMTQAREYFDFLGYRFLRTGKGRLIRFPSPKSVKRFREKLKRLTRRSNGQSMEEIIRRCNQILRGWFAYFKHSNRWIMKTLDGWLRMRLRSINRKRHKGKGRGRGLDHRKWPNNYFAKLGLFSMYTAWEEATSPR
jgi:RNA-directed DNA polymerase